MLAHTLKKREKKSIQTRTTGGKGLSHFCFSREHDALKKYRELSAFMFFSNGWD